MGGWRPRQDGCDVEGQSGTALYFKGANRVGAPARLLHEDALLLGLGTRSRYNLLDVLIVVDGSFLVVQMND